MIVSARVRMLESNVVRRYRFEHLGLPRSAVALNAEWELANSTIHRPVERHANATFLDLSHTQIFATLPFYDGVLIYSDSHHLNEIGSRRYGEEATPYFADWAVTLAKGSRERP